MISPSLIRTAAQSVSPLTLGAGLRLEDLLTHPLGCGLSTATPLQRAICRIADGIPLGDLATHPHVIASVGNVAALPNRRPAEMDVLAGIRGAKSLICANAAVQATQVCDVSGLGPGEVPRVPVISLDKDLAVAVFTHVRGIVEGSPLLRTLLVKEPTTDTVVLRHPSGRPVEIKVSAGKRAGSSLVARWIASVIFDEAPRMLGQEDGVVNLDDSLSAVRGRILPGGMVWKIGSPWAPFGPIYNEFKERFGNPSYDLVIVRADARFMNPFWWTEERCEELKRKDPQAYKTDVLAEFASVALSMFDDDMLALVTRAFETRPPEPCMHYSAAMDPATRSNGWPLVIGHKDRAGKYVVDLVREWRGSSGNPLSTKAVLGEIATCCRPYGVRIVSTDQWSGDALQDTARDAGLVLAIGTQSTTDKVRVFDTMKRWAVDRKLELPPDGTLRDDLKRVKRRITQAGASIELPKTSDGRHCDIAAALGVLFGEPMLDPDPEPEVVARDASEQADVDRWERQQAESRFEL